MPYGSSRRFDQKPDEVEARVREALAAQGFGVLSEIDVAAALKEKLGVERPPYKILGACNPTLANRALQADSEIGLLLPCNVVVYSEEDHTVVSFVDPHAMLDVAANPELKPIAAEAAERLEAAFAAI